MKRWIHASEDANFPNHYKVHEFEGKFYVVDEDSGESIGEFDSLEEAKASILDENTPITTLNHAEYLRRFCRYAEGHYNFREDNHHPCFNNQGLAERFVNAFNRNNLGANLEIEHRRGNEGENYFRVK